MSKKAPEIEFPELFLSFTPFFLGGGMAKERALFIEL